MKEHPNKYNLKPTDIRKLVIVDWDKLKTCTWKNNAKKNGTWYCHLEGCNLEKQQYDEEDEFWIGFREEDNKIDYHFSCYGGMCNYKFNTFYDFKEIENRFDAGIHINTIKWLNKMIDDGILALPA